jgi:hypothetical protein
MPAPWSAQLTRSIAVRGRECIERGVQLGQPTVTELSASPKTPDGSSRLRRSPRHKTISEAVGHPRSEAA